MFWWLIDTAVCNAFLVHKEGCKDQQLRPLSHSAFLAKLADQFLGEGDLYSPSASGVKRRLSAEAALERPPGRLIGKHFIVPIADSKSKHTAQCDCVKCKEAGKRSRSVYECDNCQVGLHLLCFKEWHQ